MTTRTCYSSIVRFMGLLGRLRWSARTAGTRVFIDAAFIFAVKNDLRWRHLTLLTVRYICPSALTSGASPFHSIGCGWLHLPPFLRPLGFRISISSRLCGILCELEETLSRGREIGDEFFNNPVPSQFDLLVGFSTGWTFPLLRKVSSNAQTAERMRTAGDHRCGEEVLAHLTPEGRFELSERGQRCGEPICAVCDFILFWHCAKRTE